MKHNINSIDDVVRRLNDGIERTAEELQMCKEWLTVYQAACQLSLNKLDELCWEHPDWFFDWIFGE